MLMLHVCSVEFPQNVKRGIFECQSSQFWYENLLNLTSEDFPLLNLYLSININPQPPVNSLVEFNRPVKKLAFSTTQNDKIKL